MPFPWEEESIQLFSVTMEGVVFCREKEDAWVWLIGNSKVYSVRLAYDHLLSHSLSIGPLTVPDAVFRSFWSSCMPSKVLTFSW